MERDKIFNCPARLNGVGLQGRGQGRHPTPGWEIQRNDFESASRLLRQRRNCAWDLNLAPDFRLCEEILVNSLSQQPGGREEGDVAVGTSAMDPGKRCGRPADQHQGKRHMSASEEVVRDVVSGRIRELRGELEQVEVLLAAMEGQVRLQPLAMPLELSNELRSLEFCFENMSESLVLMDLCNECKGGATRRFAQFVAKLCASVTYWRQGCVNQAFSPATP